MQTGEEMRTQEMQNKVFCQSCGMPLEKTEDLGTNSNGSVNEKYCTYCYQAGAFTDANVTVDEMIDRCSNIMANMNIMSYDEAKKMNSNFIPYLKRWKK
ncbi:MAG: zinc ribbon domain-containing protein [Methanolobus sp.]|nr:zinc ribbon domain-containing protein [Methanolobus sp.]